MEKEKGLTLGDAESCGEKCFDQFPVYHKAAQTDHVQIVILYPLTR